jgi:hypothetical protein
VFVISTTKCPVGSEVLTAVTMKIAILWDITPFSPIKVNERFGGTYRLHLHGGFLSGLLLDLEDGDDTFLGNVS